MVNVTRPDVAATVDGIVPTRPARPVEPGEGGARRVLVEPAEPEAQPRVIQERRRIERRGADRRQRQVAVLMDTRVSQRRMERRRAADEAPMAIDVEA